MSGEFIQIKLTPGAQAIASSLQTWPQRMLAAMVVAMDLQNQATIAHISSKRMRGNNNKPFPAALGILGIRTSHLMKSLRASKATVAAEKINSSIGTNVSYAGVHEFGAVVQRTQLAGSVRLRTDAKGNRIRQAKNPNLFIFAKDSHKRAETVPFAGGKRFSIRYPNRAPITRGIEDRVNDYSNAMSAAIESTQPL